MTFKMCKYMDNYANVTEMYVFKCLPSSLEFTNL